MHGHPELTIALPPLLEEALLGKSVCVGRAPASPSGLAGCTLGGVRRATVTFVL